MSYIQIQPSIRRQSTSVENISWGFSGVPILPVWLVQRDLPPPGAATYRPVTTPVCYICSVLSTRALPQCLLSQCIQDSSALVLYARMMSLMGALQTGQWAPRVRSCSPHARHTHMWPHW